MGVIRGTVCDAAGRPVAGARVAIVEAPGSVPDTAALTDAAGRFALAAARPGRYVVAASTDAAGSVQADVQVHGDEATVQLNMPR